MFSSKSFLNFLLAVLFTLPAQAQVMSPAWVYGKIAQKPLHSTAPPADREIASYKNLEIRTVNGWKLVQNKPETIRKRVLLLPGFLGTDYVFHEMLHDPLMVSDGTLLIAGNAPYRATIPEYAELVEQLAEKEKAEILVGHSYMATVLIEVSRLGNFHGKLVLLSPALEPDDEPFSTRALDLVTRDPLMKDVAWAGMYLFMEDAFVDFFQPGDMKHVYGAAREARKTPIPQAQQMLVHYFNHLRNEDLSLMKTVHLTSSEIHYVNGGLDVVQLKPENKKLLKTSGKVSFHYYPKASHMVMIDEAKSLNKLLRSL